MNALVFLGPSLPFEQASAIYPDADYRPPIVCGDILRALKKSTLKRIVIIDGLFHYTAAVWHKEILLALSKGIEVYGASSMGALRAAETEAFGMVGHGKVFELFRDQVLNDDDEVAVLHAGAKQGFAVKTDAMVNIRCTLAAATKAKVVTQNEHDALIGYFTQCYYQQRDLLLGIKAFAREHHWPDERAETVLDWCAKHKVEQKQLDAISLLTHLAATPVAELQAPSFSLNNTLGLRTLASQA